MARTKSTKGKVTGAPAPRKELLPKSKAKVEAMATAKRTVRTRKATAKTNDAVAPSTTNTLTVTRSDDRFEEKPNCKLCHNGGSLILCDNCNFGVCEKCVRVPDMDGPFSCPDCHGFETPYPYDLIGRQSVRSSIGSIHLEKLAIISFRLAGMDRYGDTAKSVYDTLNPYLCDNVVLFQIQFDFGDADAVQEAVDRLVLHLESPEYKTINRFLVTLTSHSDPDRGDIHVEPGEKSAASLEQLMDILLPDDLRNILRRGGAAAKNAFLLLACGSVVRIPESSSHLRALTAGNLFHEVLAFGGEHLQYCLAHPFINDAALNYFIYGRNSLAMIIKDHHVMGAHSDVVIFSEKASWKYMWSHEGRQPFGQAVPKQCVACRRIATYSKRRVDATSSTPPRLDRELFLVCKACQNKVLYQFPPHGSWVTGQAPAPNSRGDWLRVPL